MDSKASGLGAWLGSLIVITSSFFLFGGEAISMTVSSLPNVDCDSLLGFEEEGLPRPAWSAGEGTMSPPVKVFVLESPEADAAGG